MKRFLTVGFCVAAFVGASTGQAVAGEVKGPSTPGNTNETGALDHANSICAASGLNDLNVGSGQLLSRVQTAADSWKYYSLPKGSVGTWGLCTGGSNDERLPR